MTDTYPRRYQRGRFAVREDLNVEVDGLEYAWDGSPARRFAVREDLNGELIAQLRHGRDGQRGRFAVREDLNSYSQCTCVHRRDTQRGRFAVREDLNGNGVGELATMDLHQRGSTRDQPQVGW